MGIIVHVTIVVLGNLLLVSVMICAIKVKPLEIGISGTIPCDHIENDHEVRLVQWFRSRSIDEFENGDPSLARWAEGETRSLQNYYMDNITFSLVIEEATLEDEGLYECSVLSGDLARESNYYIRTVMYALPRTNPVITLDTDLNRVNCTVEHVRPLIYPVFEFLWSPDSIEVYAVLNEDGTYMTSVSCTLPHAKSISLVDCHFSYLHVGLGSSDLSDITTDSPMEFISTSVSHARMCTSVAFAGNGCNTVNHTATTVVIVLLSVANVVLLITLKIFTKYHRDLQDRKKAMEKLMHHDIRMEVEVTTRGGHYMFFDL